MNTKYINQYKEAKPLNQPLTYQLKNSFQSSDEFYYQLHIFSDQVVDKGFSRFDDIIKQFRNSSTYLKNDIYLSDTENLLDILIIGVLWNEHKGKWDKNIYLNARLFMKLNEMRKTKPNLKGFVDSMKGRIGKSLLDKPTVETTELTLANFNKLKLWLSSTNEYNEEVLRIESWLDYLESIPEPISQNFLTETIEFANWFKRRASNALGSYTSGVNHFLLSHKDKYENKEDFFFTGRKEIEYHLNMVGAAIMNQSMQKDFLETLHKILLLPTCMSKNIECKSMEIMTGRVCTHCTSDCNISLVTKEVRKEGVFTYLVSHSSNFSESLKRWANQKQIGLIGTACTLNLLMGGFEMKRLNIPAQCVFLDYSGCKRHWTENGVPTHININQIKNLVKVQKNQAV